MRKFNLEIFSFFFVVFFCRYEKRKVTAGENVPGCTLFDGEMATNGKKKKVEIRPARG